MLFAADDLAAWLDEDVTADRAAMVERVVWGWLRPVLGVPARPDTVAEELFSWAIELGGIAFENPAGLAAYQLGEERQQFSAERRNQILEEVRSGGTTPGGIPSPRGSFPPPTCYPDPARPVYSRYPYL